MSTDQNGSGSPQSEQSVMQHVLILSRLVPERNPDGTLFALSAVSHDGRSVRFEAQAEQRINLTALEFQQTPLLLLTDQLYEPVAGLLVVPGSALVSIVPIPADHIRALLERGEADQLLAAVSAQLF